MHSVQRLGRFVARDVERGRGVDVVVQTTAVNLTSNEQRDSDAWTTHVRTSSQRRRGEAS